MLRQRMVWSVAIAVAAVLSMEATSAKADVVGGSLLYLDAADCSGSGVAGLGSGTTWVNKGSLGASYDGLVTSVGLGSTAWAGDGTTSNPYTLQVRHGNGGSDSAGFVQVQNSYTTGNALDNTVYTYEIWTKINGTNGGSNGVGVMMSHNTNASGQGNGSLGYSVVDNYLWMQGGSNSGSALPNSTDLVGTGYHQIVLTRAGDGASDMNWYLDGALKGTFQSDANASVDAWFTIGCQSWASRFTTGADMDVAIARVYGRALTGSEVLQNFDADCGTFAIVPEPTSLVLIGIGVICLQAYAWRKRKCALGCNLM